MGAFPPPSDGIREIELVCFFPGFAPGKRKGGAVFGFSEGGAFRHKKGKGEDFYGRSAAQGVCGRGRLPGEGDHRLGEPGIRGGGGDGVGHQPSDLRRLQPGSGGGQGPGQRGPGHSQPSAPGGPGGDPGLRGGGHGPGERGGGAASKRHGVYRRQHPAAFAGAASQRQAPPGGGPGKRPQSRTPQEDQRFAAAFRAALLRLLGEARPVEGKGGAV